MYRKHTPLVPYHFVYSPQKHRRSRLEDALEVIRLISSIPGYSITPQKMGLLAAGLQLFLAWRYLAGLVENFEARGLACLWAIAVSALVIGQVAKHLTPKPVELDEDLDLVLPDQCSSLKGAPRVKEGQELTVPRLHYPAGGKGEVLLLGQQEEDEEDMGTIKRRAQEEAAAKLAKYRAEVQQLLASIRKEASGSSSSPVSSQLLFLLADQLFASSINLSEFVELGGVPVVVEAVRALTRSLAVAQQQPQQDMEIQEEEQPQQQQQALQAAALPAMLQATWVLLQLAQGPPACRAAVQDTQCSRALLAAAQTVSGLPPSAAGATEAVMRNIWWTLLTACCVPAPAPQGSSHQASSAEQQRKGSSGSRDALLQLYHEYGAVSMLEQLVTLRHGLSAGWVAAAHLGLFMQLGHQQQQQQQGAAPEQQQRVAGGSSTLVQGLSEAAVQSMLSEESLTGLCYMMVHLRLEQQQPAQELMQQQLCSRMRSLVEGMLHYLLTFHSADLLQQLLELQLLGCFAAHCHPRLGRMVVCQLLSSKGQEVMAAVEEGYELDVPLALAQIVPLKVHVKLPAPAPAPAAAGVVAAGQQPAAGEIEPEGAGQEQQQEQEQQLEQQSDDLYTDILASRLLLQHQRLGELLSAFCDELQAPPDALQQQRQQLAASNPVAAAADAAAQESSVVTAGLSLVQHLMSRDLQLQAAQHVRGDCVSDSISSSASSRSLEEALAMPDHSGTYSKVLAGMVAPERLPAGSDSSSACAADMTLPAVDSSGSASSAADAPAAVPRAGQVVFRFGEQVHAVDAATFKQIRRCSALVSSILGRVRSTQQEPVTVLAIPQFTDEANCWVLRCLERWLSTKALQGFSVLQAAKLWVAADFLQVDDLQVACEDVIAAGFKQDPQAHAPVALELCARHVDSGSRLLRLLVQQLLRGCSTTGSNSSSAMQAAASSVQAQGEGLQLLRRLLEHHSSVLMPVMLAELRDRLVTLCMLNAGQDAEDPSALVG